MLLQKTLYETESGFKVILKDFAHKKSYMCEGNIPRLPNGINLKVKIVDAVILDYEIQMTDRNQKILTNKGIDVEDFNNKIRLHKESGLLWKYIENGLHPYEAYPFEEADKVFQKLGKSGDDEERVKALVLETRTYFRKNRKESCEIIDYVEAFRRIEKKGVYPLLSFPKVIDTLNSENVVLAKGKMYDKELRLANAFITNDVAFRNKDTHDILTRNEIEKALESETDLTEEQRSACYELNNSHITIVTGGAGVGKTKTIKSILSVYEKICGKGHSLLLAPTGKASCRLTEVTGHEAKTIHSALRKGEDFIFYNERNPLPYNLFIVDEGSMVDTLLMKDLLSAIPNGAKIYFVGDHNQLYPVGCGEPFFDFMKTCKVVYLTKNFRQGQGTIDDNAKRILKGEPLKNTDDFRIVNIKEDEILQYVTENTQNISPYNDLNKQINDRIIASIYKNVKSRFLEPVQDKGKTPTFYEGEKIIFLRNRNEYVNGDIGTVVSVQSGSIDVSLNGNIITVSKEYFKEIAPAYALTVHKMQGSECDEVNIFLDKDDSFVTKRMMYTAVTRAKKRVNLYLYSA